MSVYSSRLMSAKKQKEPKCPLRINERIHKMWYVHTKDYYSVLKRNEVLTHATARMDLENRLC